MYHGSTTSTFLSRTFLFPRQNENQNQRGSTVVLNDDDWSRFSYSGWRQKEVTSCDVMWRHSHWLCFVDSVWAVWQFCEKNMSGHVSGRSQSEAWTDVIIWRWTDNYHAISVSHSAHFSLHFTGVKLILGLVQRNYSKCQVGRTRTIITFKKKL